jgi:hypothetical protein
MSSDSLARWRVPRLISCSAAAWSTSSASFGPFLSSFSRNATAAAFAPFGSPLLRRACSRNHQSSAVISTGASTQDARGASMRPSLPSTRALTDTNSRPVRTRDVAICSAEETSTRPVGRCPTSVYLQYWRASLGAHLRHGRPVCSVAPSSQAPTPPSGAPKARGLRAKARTEQSSMLPRCAVI